MHDAGLLYAGASFGLKKKGQNSLIWVILTVVLLIRHIATTAVITSSII